jgi:hypothetical protein
MRTTRWRLNAPISGVQVFEVPPRPCTQTTASPSPSSSTAILSTSWNRHRARARSARLEAVLDRADAVDLDPHDIARGEPLRRLEPMPTPDGVPVAMTSPGTA